MTPPARVAVHRPTTRADRSSLRRREHEPLGARPGQTVRLVDVEPDLAEGLTADELAFVRHHLLVPSLRLPVGGWAPDQGLERFHATTSSRRS